MIELLNKDLLLYLSKYLNLAEKLYFSTCCTSDKLNYSINRRYIYRVICRDKFNKYLSFNRINKFKLDSYIIEELEKAKKLVEIAFDSSDDDEL